MLTDLTYIPNISCTYLLYSYGDMETAMVCIVHNGIIFPIWVCKHKQSKWQYKIYCYDWLGFINKYQYGHAYIIMYKINTMYIIYTSYNCDTYYIANTIQIWWINVIQWYIIIWLYIAHVNKHRYNTGRYNWSDCSILYYFYMKNKNCIIFSN